MKKYFIVVIFIILVSSCTSVGTAPILPPSSATINTSNLTSTVTETPQPTFSPTLMTTSTPTLSPDIMIYELESNVNSDDQELVKQGVHIARHYLVNNFGADISQQYVIRVRNDPNDTRHNHVTLNEKGYVMYINVGNPELRDFYPESVVRGVTHEVTHLWQSERGDSLRGCMWRPGETNTVKHVLAEGQAQYVAVQATYFTDLDDPKNINAIKLLLNPLTEVKESFGPMLAVNWLINRTTSNSWTIYCDAVGSGEIVDVAFQNAFGLTIDEFEGEYNKYLMELGNIDAAKLDAIRAIDPSQLTLDEIPLLAWPLPGLNPTLDQPNLKIMITDMDGNPHENLQGIVFCHPTSDIAGCARIENLNNGVFEFRVLSDIFLLRLKKPGIPLLNIMLPPLKYTHFFEVFGDELQIIQVKIDNRAAIMYENNNEIVDNSLGIAYWLYDDPHPNVIVEFTNELGVPLTNYQVLYCWVAPIDPDSGFYCQGDITDEHGILSTQLLDVNNKNYVWRMFFDRPGESLSAPFDFQSLDFKIPDGGIKNKIVVPKYIAGETQAVGFQNP